MGNLPSVRTEIWPSHRTMLPRVDSSVAGVLLTMSVLHPILHSLKYKEILNFCKFIIIDILLTGFVGFSLDIGKIEYIKNSETAHIVWCCLLEIDIFAFLRTP